MMNVAKEPQFVFVLALVLFAVGLSGCGGNEIPSIEVTGPPAETVT